MERVDLDKGWAEGLTTHRFMVALGAMLGVAFWPVLIGGQAFFYRDYGFLGYPFAWFHQQAFVGGEFPGWNALIHCGVPHFAQWNTMVLYPGSLIYVLFPLPWSLAWFCVLHLGLAGAGMYRLGWETTGCRLAAAVGGVAFPFCGMVLGCLIYPNYLVALGWMPWLFSAARRAWRGKVWDGFPAVFFGTMQMLSGAPELVLLTWLLLAALMAGDAVAERSTAPVGRFGLLVLMIAGLSAFQLLPFFELLSLSQRSVATGGAFWSLPPAGWINFLLPTFSSFVSNQGVVIQIGQSFLPSVYLGGILVVLALAGLSGGRHRDRLTAAGFGLLCLLWSFGPALPPWRWLSEVAPIGFARFPVKAVLPLPFIATWLAMIGVKRLREGMRPWSMGGVSVALLGAGWLVECQAPLLEGNARLVGLDAAARAGMVLLTLFALRGGRWAILAPLLIWVDGWHHLPVLNPTIDRGAFVPGLATAYHGESLKAATVEGGTRVMLGPEAERQLHHRSVPRFYDDFIGQRLALWGNLNLLEDLPKVNGAATLTTRWSRDVEVALYGGGAETNTALVRFLGVSSRTEPGEWMRWQAVSNALPLVTAGQRMAVHAGVPPAEWDPMETVFLTEAVDDMGTNRVSAVVRKIRRGAGWIGFEAEALAPTFAVIAESWYPAWQATVNGQPAEVLRANHAFMAVKIPEGRSEVRLAYRDRSLRVGAWISVATLLFWLGRGRAWWRGCRSRNRVVTEETGGKLAS